MEYFLQQLINGITLGSIYGLIAIGYTMVYGIIGMINFAHGEVFMIGAFISLIGFMICSLLGIGSALGVTGTGGVRGVGDGGGASSRRRKGREGRTAVDTGGGDHGAEAPTLPSASAATTPVTGR